MIRRRTEDKSINNNFKLISIRLGSCLYRQLLSTAKFNSQPVSELVREAITKYIDLENKKDIGIVILEPKSCSWRSKIKQFFS